MFEYEISCVALRHIVLFNASMSIAKGAAGAAGGLHTAADTDADADADAAQAAGSMTRIPRRRLWRPPARLGCASTLWGHRCLACAAGVAL